MPTGSMVGGDVYLFISLRLCGFRRQSYTRPGPSPLTHSHHAPAKPFRSQTHTCEHVKLLLRFILMRAVYHHSLLHEIHTCLTKTRRLCCKRQQCSSSAIFQVYFYGSVTKCELKRRLTATVFSAGLRRGFVWWSRRSECIAVPVKQNTSL